MTFPNEKTSIPLNISVIVSRKNDKPVLELRRSISDIDLIKIIVSCAFHNQPIIVQPAFSDRMQSLASLIEKGIIYLDKEDNNYKFTI